MTHFRVRSLDDAADGAGRIAWAGREMPVLRGIAQRFAAEKPLAGVRIAACLHVTAETANLVLALAQGGAHVRLCGSNPLSTQDDVAAALVADHGLSVFAVRGASSEDYYADIDAALKNGPQITLDDGADLITRLHAGPADRMTGIIGGVEETTTGVTRLRAMDRAGALRCPVIAVNDALTKHCFDNRYGTGQSTLDGVIRATNVLIAGKAVCVAGYGWCGRGIALRARGLGARVCVTEVDPLRALEAVMDGFDVLPMRQAAPYADVIITATGQRDVVSREHFLVLKTGCLLANAGHFNVEINVSELAALAVAKSYPRPHVAAYGMPDGRQLYLLADGRLVNLVAAEGHPASAMDMSFANQALCAEFLALRGRSLTVAVHGVPLEIDRAVASLKLTAMAVNIDMLTTAQHAYSESWHDGT